MYYKYFHLIKLFWNIINSLRTYIYINHDFSYFSWKKLFDCKLHYARLWDSSVESYENYNYPFEGSRFMHIFLTGKYPYLPTKTTIQVGIQELRVCFRSQW